MNHFFQNSFSFLTYSFHMVQDLFLGKYLSKKVYVYRRRLAKVNKWTGDEDVFLAFMLATQTTMEIYQRLLWAPMKTSIPRHLRTMLGRIYTHMYGSMDVHVQSLMNLGTYIKFWLRKNGEELCSLSLPSKVWRSLFWGLLYFERTWLVAHCIQNNVVRNQVEERIQRLGGRNTILLNWFSADLLTGRKGICSRM